MSILESYKAIIFDFDGVITDSAMIKTDAFVALYNDYSQDVRDKVLAFHTANQGVSRFDKFVYFETKILGNSTVSQDAMDSLSKRFSNIVRKKVIEAPFIQGVENFLNAAQNAQLPCFVASATPQSELDIIVREKHLSSYFDAIYGTPMTKGQAIQTIIEQREFHSKDMVFFGDAMADYKAAHAHNVDFIGVCDRNGTHPFPSQTRTIINFDGIL